MDQIDMEVLVIFGPHNLAVQWTGRAVPLRESLKYQPYLALTIVRGSLGCH